MVLRAADDPTDHLRIVAPCAPRCSAAATTTSSATRSRDGGALVVQHARRRPTRRRHRSSAGLGLPARAPRGAPLALARRAARPHRPRPPGPRARLRRGPPARRVAPPAVRDRPGPGVERGHRRQPARLPPLGRPADRRGLAGRRVRAARDRRRRRAHHDDPRRQGPRVPDHHRARPVGRPGGHAQRRRGALPARTAARSATGMGKDGGHRGVRGAVPDRRADGLRRAAPAPLRRLHPGHGPPRGVAAPRASARTRRQAQRNRTNAEVLLARHGRRCVDDLPDLGGDAGPLPVDPAAVPAPPPAFATWAAERAAALARRRPSRRGRRHRAHRRGHPDWVRRARAGAGRRAEPLAGTPVQPACSTSPTARADDRRRPTTATRARSSPRSTPACRSGRATSTCRRG